MQVGGSLYTDCVIQPAVFSEKNKLSFLEGCVVKRVTGEGADDIRKAIHELQYD